MSTYFGSSHVKKVPTKVESCPCGPGRRERGRGNGNTSSGPIRDAGFALQFILDVIYEQRERVFHRDIQTRENNV
jgi:hypothetical protein